MFPEVNLIGQFPPWWDWVMFGVSAIGLSWVGLTGLIALRRHNRSKPNHWDWFQGGIHPSIVGLSLGLWTILFWFGHERHSVEYLLVLLTFAFVSTIATIRLVVLKRTSNK